MTSGKPWPKITVVTVSLNQARYLEEALRSILLQGYPNLEHIVIDGGSSDGSREILEKYSSTLTYWVSEKDKGQADALNKGLARATGAIFGFINSDDLLMPDVLARVAVAMSAADVVAGGVRHFWDEFDNPDRREDLFNALIDLRGMCSGCALYYQQGIWTRLDFMRRAGPFENAFRYFFDQESMIRVLALHPRVHYLSDPIAAFRYHSSSKTIGEAEAFSAEGARLCDTLFRTGPEEVRSMLDRLHRERFWQTRLKTLEENEELGRVRRLGRVLAESLQEPRVRFSRYTLGFLRRQLAAGKK